MFIQGCEQMEEKLKKFRVKIYVDGTYFAESEEECNRLIYKDFPGLEITDEIKIEEVKVNK